MLSSGKAKKYFFHKGNAMLRNLAASMLDEYAGAKTKLDKSLIISDVAEHVRQNGNFVKRDTTTEKWVVAEDLLCREKISAVFRDALHQRSRNATPLTKRAQHHAVAMDKRHSAPSGLLAHSIAAARRELEEAPSMPKAPSMPALQGMQAARSMPALQGLQALQRQPAATANWKYNFAPASATFGFNLPPAVMPGFAGSASDELTRQQLAELLPSVSANAAKSHDLLSIFNTALAGIKEDGDPFEPKPLYEGSRTA